MTLKRTEHIEQLINTIPDEMKKYDQWTLVPNYHKKSHQITGSLAKCDDSSTWATFDECVQELYACEDWIYLAFCFTDNDPFCFIDIDGIAEGKSVVNETNLYDTIRYFNSYTELSRSGGGIHIVGYGDYKNYTWKKHNGIGFEMYSSDHFMTFTGTWINDGTRDFKQLTNIQEQSDKTYLKYPREYVTGEVGSNDTSVTEVFSKIQKGFWLLLSEGDAPNGDESSADFSLLRKLAKLTNNDPQKMEEVFNMTRRGQREKWVKRADYRERSIRNALVGGTK